MSDIVEKVREYINNTPIEELKESYEKFLIAYSEQKDTMDTLAPEEPTKKAANDSKSAYSYFPILQFLRTCDVGDYHLVEARNGYRPAVNTVTALINCADKRRRKRFVTKAVYLIDPTSETVTTTIFIRVLRVE